MEKDEYIDYLLSLPQDEYQRELGQLLVAVIDLACERDTYKNKVEKQRKTCAEKE